MKYLLPLLLPTALTAEIALQLPVACTLDRDCYIQQFVDHDPGPGASDFSCGTLSYDGHKGTDFALPTLRAMQRGVDVRAAAAGTVTGTRDTMPDIRQGAENAADVSGRECGNGVVIAHANGYETQYCHLKKGSLRVRTGDSVNAGDTLGQIGLSGETQFPHLHFSLRQDGQVVDPFDPDGAITCDTASDETYFDPPLAAPAGGIITSAFNIGVPTFDAIKRGPPPFNGLPKDAPAIVAWSHMFGARAGDIFDAVITGPQGEVIRNTETLDRTQAQLFRAVGRRKSVDDWPTGRYTAVLTMRRGDVVLDQQTISLEIN